MIKIDNIKNRLHDITINRNTPFVLLLVCLIVDLTYLLVTIVASVYIKESLFSINEWVEYSFLSFNILFLVIIYKKGDRHLNDALIGELLAVFAVTCISFLGNVIKSVIEDSSLDNILYLIIEIIYCSQAFILFLTHVLMEKKKKPIHLLNTSLNLVVIAAILLIAYDIHILIRHPHDIKYIYLTIDEILTIIIEFLLTFVVRSIEYIKVDMNRIKELQKIQTEQQLTSNNL